MKQLKIDEYILECLRYHLEESGYLGTEDIANRNPKQVCEELWRRILQNHLEYTSYN